MPGITGIIRGQSYPNGRRDLHLMTEVMRHQKFYRGGQYIDEERGIYIGWEAHPNSLGACMPVVSLDGRFVIVIVGEHFPQFQTVRTPKGIRLTEETERELFALYEKSEDEFLRSLNGWFCGIVADRRTARITLFNDRYGMGRVYWHESADEFLFGSEAKSLLRVRPQLRRVETGALAEYLSFNCVMGNRSLFKDVSLLPGGSAWTFDSRRTHGRRKYFDFSEWEQQPTLSTGKFLLNFNETMSSILPAYSEPTEEVGLSLTAGLDTRLILAAADERRQILPSYTFGGLWGETFDVRTARKLAQACGDSHEVIRIDEPFLRDFAEYAQKSVYISDGTHDAHGAHDVYFNRIARDIAPIRLTGKFGSEVVRTRKLVPWIDFPRNIVRADLARLIDEALIVRRSCERPHPLTRVVTDEIAWYEYGRVAVEQSAVILRTPYLDNNLVKLMYQADAGIRDSRDLQSNFVIGKSQRLAKIPTNLGRIGKDRALLSRLTYLPLWALFKVEYTYLYATPHWLTRIDRGLENLRLERLITGRQKFEGYRIWFKTHFSDYIRDLLLSQRAECTNFFNKECVKRMVTSHLAGTHNYFSELNKLLTIELIYVTLLSRMDYHNKTDEQVRSNCDARIAGLTGTESPSNLTVH